MYDGVLFRERGKNIALFEYQPHRSVGAGLLMGLFGRSGGYGRPRDDRRDRNKRELYVEVEDLQVRTRTWGLRDLRPEDATGILQRFIYVENNLTYDGTI